MSRQGKARPRTVENVKTFWNKEAQDWGDDPRVTIRDHYFRLLNIDTICTLIKGRHSVLDVGCGTGFSTLFYSEVVHHLIGADYAEKMIEKAQRFLTDQAYFDSVMKEFAVKKKPHPKNIRFEEANIVNLHYGNKMFDCVISERVLVNLPTRVLQTQAIQEVARVLKPKGIWVLGEASHEGHKTIDQLRNLFQLGILEKYWHNLYLEEHHFENFARRYGFTLRKKIKYETYQFLTKVIHPLVVAPDEPEFICGFNNAARLISKKYPDYQSVLKIGLDTFLNKRFRTVLSKFDKGKVRKFDAIVPKILKINPDFTGCSHHVLYLFDKAHA